MKFYRLFTLVASTVIIATAMVACSSTGVVPMGRDTYMITGSTAGFTTESAVRARLLREADKWAKERGLVMVPLGFEGNDAVPGQRMASSEVIFRAVTPQDYENIRPTYERAPDHHQVIEIRQR